ncbi:MAG: pseudouridine synthase [Acetatifactor sp.]|nr:pseudouridine synthase [Acetatifactor sp.]
MELVRLNKYLAHAGICSRREADRLIESGRVLVNGIVPSTGSQVCEKDTITVDGKVVQGREKRVVLAYYKPVGITCTERDPHAKKTIAQAVKYPIRVTYAGRLDQDSEGLLLLTNDGDLIQGMMRGANRHEKEYIVKTDKEVAESFLDQMGQGIFLKELGQTTRPCTVEKIGKYTFRIVLTQGLNRQIRRMCEACGYRVRSLKRIRVMHVLLEDLKPGEYRELGQEDIDRLYRDCGLSANDLRE